MDFGGWEMPVQYGGVIAEHLAVRRSAGIFDVSHLGRFTATGTGTAALLGELLCNDVGEISPGRAQYTMALTPDGGVVDDIIVWRFGEESFWVLPNAANYTDIMVSFGARAAPTVALTPRREDTAMLAVQGPDAPALVEGVLGVVPGRFRTTETEWYGGPVRMAGTGYTGEPGAEVVVEADQAGPLFEAFVEAGVVPCGLGARDTLRLEMGYPLWGQDLDRDTTPLEAGLDWVVDWDHDFVGKSALETQRREGVRKTLVGFVMEERAIPRHGYGLRANGTAGRVSSGNYSPILERGIGMGFLSPTPPEGTDRVEVEIRDEWKPARIQRPPFVG